jgi:hypothetical protein
MLAILKFLRETKLWFLLPGLILILIVVLLGLLLGSPIGAFIYTIF